MQASGVVYLLNGERIAEKAEIARIEALAIPPAWADVEIARSPRAKVLARGIDAAGRVQTIYHPAFRRRQDRRKFERMQRFGQALPRLRAQVDRDLRRRTLGRERITAGVVRLIDSQLFRVGSSQYAKRNRSYGVATLRSKHVRVTGACITFDFIAKSGKRTRRTVRDARVARLLVRLKRELSMPEVFGFLDEEGVAHPLRRRHINAYVKRYAGDAFTAKDFRTWGATVLVATALLDLDADQSASLAGREAAMREAVSAAADRLGNTPAVAKASYIDPRLFSAVKHPRILQRAWEERKRSRPRKHQSLDERSTLVLLKMLTTDAGHL
ncbi:DNA topoisomerase IB [Leucobacter soli]|uniref:DNA topoisomerase IB n=1 Tax=Leucobacter soli TaxID=2812850 RepID=UPI00360B962A